jgi:alcohol dehydrogenase (cytochrome c)
MTGTLNASWPGDMWKTGGGATWLGGSYDADTDTIVFGAGNPAPWNSHLRKGDNLYAASRIGMDPATGEIKWHYQTTPWEGWDYDGVNEVVAYEGSKGEKRWATADRNGFFYVLNREDGAYVSSMPFVQNINWASKIGDDGRPVYLPENRPGDPSAAADGKKGEVVFAVPGFLGGKNWMPMAHSPKTGLFYVPSNEWGMDIWNEPVTYKKGAAYLGSGFTIKPLFEDYIGSLKAIDPNTMEVKWEYKNNAPLWGGVMTTAGGLVFTGTPEGYFKALDADTGEVLWQFQTGSGIVGQPVSWEMDGEQYVSVVSGWGGAVPLWGGEVAKKVSYLNQGGSVWVFKLPRQMASN